MNSLEKHMHALHNERVACQQGMLRSGVNYVESQLLAITNMKMEAGILVFKK